MLSRAINYFIPPSYHNTEESSRKARLTVVVYLIVLLNALFYTAVSLNISYFGGVLSQAPLFLVTAICLLLYKSGFEPYKVAGIFFITAILSIGITVFGSGGFFSPLLPWLATTPIVALLVAGKRMGVFALVGQSAMLVFLYYLQIYGIEAPESWVTEFSDSFYFSTYAGLIWTLFAVGYVFENGKSYAMNLLMHKNDELGSVITTLKSTQDQLIQQEKLASLGQLTAGIAHEIKNPLNFVNNFSELSIELVQEARDELAKADSGDASMVGHTLDDIEANLKVILNHGSRANNIVKSMLQHSREGKGHIVPTDLNALLIEYCNLAFHGMRAGSKSIDLELEFDLDDLVGEVDLVAEDMSRVIMNICNNAFDSMHEKKSKLGAEVLYKPKMRVSTRYEQKQAIIRMSDNGTGIPDDIREKILQPFFTTKKGTDGTGLGLSITHDIILAHGGHLDVEGKLGEGATFVISLPVKNTTS
jgi:two-component system, NtrC family, sensor kinase